MNAIKFVHSYHKLSRTVFTTVRGKSWAKTNVGDVTTCETPEGAFRVKVISVEAKRVRDMSVQFVKDDAEYSGKTLGSVQDFIDLLNSFRAPFWTQVTMDSEMTVLTLEKLPT